MRSPTSPSHPHLKVYFTFPPRSQNSDVLSIRRQGTPLIFPSAWTRHLRFPVAPLPPPPFPFLPRVAGFYEHVTCSRKSFQQRVGPLFTKLRPGNEVDFLGEFGPLWFRLVAGDGHDDFNRQRPCVAFLALNAASLPRGALFRIALRGVLDMSASCFPPSTKRLLFRCFNSP